MNEEEKKAIEFVKKRTKELKKYAKRENELVYDDIIVNLIEKMKICINILDDELKERDETINKKEIIIEKLQKENELAKKQVEYDKTHIYTPQTIKLNYIPIQKIKDKIKEEKMPLTIVGGIRNKKILGYGISLGRMQILQELLEWEK